METVEVTTRGTFISSAGFLDHLGLKESSGGAAEDRSLLSPAEQERAEERESRRPDKQINIRIRRF